MKYLHKNKEGNIPNLYSISIEWDDRSFVVALQGGQDFEGRLNELIKSYYDQELESGSIQILKGSTNSEDLFEAKTLDGSNVYIENIEIW